MGGGLAEDGRGGGEDLPGCGELGAEFVPAFRRILRAGTEERSGFVGRNDSDAWCAEAHGGRIDDGRIVATDAAKRGEGVVELPAIGDFLGGGRRGELGKGAHEAVAQEFLAGVAELAAAGLAEDEEPAEGEAEGGEGDAGDGEEGAFVPGWHGGMVGGSGCGGEQEWMELRKLRFRGLPVCVRMGGW